MQKRLQIALPKSSTLINALIICYIAVFSGSAIYTIFPNIKFISVFAVLIILVYLGIHSFKRRIGLKDAAFWVQFAVLIINYFISKDTNWMTYVIFGSMLITASFFADRYNIYGFSALFRKFMTIMTVISICAYLLLNNTSLLDWLPRYSNSNGASFAVGYIFNYLTAQPERNAGYLWEPGVHATFLCYALIFEILFNENKPDWKRLVLFSVGIITASSSAGFVIWALCLFLLIVKGRKDRKYTIVSHILSFLAIIVLIYLTFNMDTIIALLPFGDERTFSKLMSEQLTASERWLAFSHNWELFKTNPFFGVGLSKAAALSTHYSNTSTTTYLMSVFGIWGVLFTVLIVIGIFKQRQLNIYTKTILVAIMMCIVNKEPHSMILLTWIFMYLLLKPNQTHERSKRIIEKEP